LLVARLPLPRNLRGHRQLPPAFPTSRRGASPRSLDTAGSARRVAIPLCAGLEVLTFGQSADCEHRSLLLHEEHEGSYRRGGARDWETPPRTDLGLSV